VISADGWVAEEGDGNIEKGTNVSLCDRSVISSFFCWGIPVEGVKGVNGSDGTDFSSGLVPITGGRPGIGNESKPSVGAAFSPKPSAGGGNTGVGRGKESFSFTGSDTAGGSPCKVR